MSAVRDKPSDAFRLGRFGWPVTAGALAYGVAAIVYLAWPRTPSAAWHANYAVLLSTVVVLASGLLGITKAGEVI